MDGTITENCSVVEQSKDVQNVNDVDLPPETTLLWHQTAGHKHGQGKTKLGVLKHKNGDILKPLINGDRRSIRELSFYENVNQNYKADPLLQELKNFLPAYHDTWHSKVHGKDMKYLRLEDVCEPFQKPSILDIKVGACTYDPEATEEKIREEKEKYPLAEVMGFYIVGMKVYNYETKLYTSQSKLFGRQQTPDTITNGLGLYLTTNDYINCLILCGFLHKMLQLTHWFSKQRKFMFYSSSLLFVYEGNLASWISWAEGNDLSICGCNISQCSTNNPIKHCTSLNIKPVISEDVCSTCGLCVSVCLKLQSDCQLFRVVMIDFAHIFSATEEDSKYLFGLKNLIQTFKELLKINLRNVDKF